MFKKMFTILGVFSKHQMKLNKVKTGLTFLWEKLPQQFFLNDSTR